MYLPLHLQPSQEAVVCQTKQYMYLLLYYISAVYTHSSRPMNTTICMYSHHIIARVWINQVRLPILHVVSWTGKMNISLSAFAPENLASRDGFGSLVPRQPAHLHTQAESGAYIRDSSRFPQRRPLLYLKRPDAIESVPSLSDHAIAHRWRSLPRVRLHRASKPLLQWRLRFKIAWFKRITCLRESKMAWHTLS